MLTPSPHYVWIDNPPSQRLTHVYFRREAELPAEPATARFSLFASTQYHLRVNGVFVGTGPARGYAACPEYDTYDLAPFLREGSNVIAVQAAHVREATFHHLAMPGCLVAWGDVVTTEGQTTSLSTERDWRCHLSRAHEPNPPSFSFAIGPIQIFDERLTPAGWDSPGAPDGQWTPACPATDASVWGELRPRSIPPLTEEPRMPLKLLGAHDHAEGEVIVSFRQHQEYDIHLDHVPPGYMFAYTYVHSPRDQAVRIGTWWGEYYLNGREVRPLPERPDTPEREDRIFALHQGWNFLFFSYQIVKGMWQMHLAIPVDAGLRLSADSSTESGPAFRVSPAFDGPASKDILAKLPPQDPGAVPELAAVWEDRPWNTIPVSPTKALVWQRRNAPLDIPTSRVADFAIPAGQGRSLVFDMGEMLLGRIVVEFDAPAGTVIDVGHAEQLRGPFPDMTKSCLVNSAERHIAAGGRSRLETFDRRGFRYLQVDISRHTEDVNIHSVSAITNVYPYERRGAFECSDPFLNALWEYGYRTMRLCSEDVITDTPWRERTLYGGDLLPEGATTYVGSRDMRLVKRCIELFLQSHDPESGGMPGRAPCSGGGGGLYDYPMLVLINAAWVCRLEHDAEVAERCYPVFARLLDSVRHARSADGLLRTSHAFIDHGYPVKEGAICALNALISAAHDAFGDLLEMTGREGQATDARRIARETAALVNERFWDTDVCTFREALAEGQDPQPGHGVVAPAWAILFGDVPETMQTGALRRIEALLDDFDPYDEPKCVSTYNAFFLLGALYKAGAAGLAERAMRTVYRLMIESPTGTTWEHSNPDKSLSHAWSSAPTFYLSTQVLGVQVGFPDRGDLSEIVIAPQSESLDWARGTVPHPAGDVSVSWEVRGDRLLLRYGTPEGVPVRFAPHGRLARLRLDARRRTTT